MNIFIWILLLIVAFAVGFFGSFFFCRKVYRDFYKKNNLLTPDRLALMFSQSGRTPSKKKLRQLSKMMGKYRNK